MTREIKGKVATAPPKRNQHEASSKITKGGAKKI